MKIAAGLLSIVLTAAAAMAQTPGTLRGIVHDQTGAVVPAAAVTVTPQGPGPERTFSTDAEGMFNQPLPPGTYTVRVERAGFSPAVKSDVQVTAEQTVALELVLGAAGTTESVTVLATRSRLATKAETPILQTPQAITVVPEEVLDEQAATTLGEAVRNVSGVALSGSWRGSYEIFSQRGFYSDSDGNFRRNGIEISKFTSLLSPNAERIEVLKGPASILYGRIDPGGVINVVTKRPQAVRLTELDLLGGAFGYADGRLDTTGPIGDGRRALYRLNVAFDRSGSYRDEVEKRNTFISPSITLSLGSRTRWDIDVEHKREGKTDDVGIAAPTSSFDALDDMPINTFLGEPDAQVEIAYTNGVSTFEHLLGGAWTFRNVLSYVAYDISSNGVSLGTLAADQRTVSRTASFNESDLGSAVVEASFLGNLSTGPVRHRIAAGGSFHHTAYEQQQGSAPMPGIDIFAPVYTGVPSISAPSSNSRQTVANSGLFIQDQIELSPQWHVQAGARLSVFEQETLNRITRVTQIIEADDVSVQAGAAYLPRPWLSFYGSYSESFAPNLAIARDGSTFGPKEAEQFEGGIKADAWGGRLTATAAVFRLTYEGTLSFIRDPQTGLFDTVQGGIQRSTGVELDVMSRPGAGLTITGLFGTLNGRVVTDPVYAPGRVLGGAPKRRANLWVAWQSPRGFGLGGGIFHQSEFKEFTSADFFLRGFTTVDAMASYRVSPRVFVQVNGKNLANERYYLNGAGRFLAYPAAPRHVVTSLQVRF